MTALRHAWRTLVRNLRGWLPVVARLGPAVGASGAAFSVVDSILLWLRIPGESGQGFRREGGHRSGVKSATHSDAKAATSPRSTTQSLAPS